MPNYSLIFIAAISSLSLLMANGLVKVNLFTVSCLISFVLCPIFTIIIRFIKNNRYILIYSLISLITYGIFFKTIAAREFSGDEIARITLLQSPLSSLTAFSYRLESGFQPIFYWINWFWFALIKSTPNDIKEYIFRIPSMFIHSVSAIVFTVLVEKIIKDSIFHTKKLIWRTIFFFLFFFNPVLFRHSYDVSPYTLVELGSVTALYLAEINMLFDFSFIPLQLFFILNSDYFILLVFPLGFIKALRLKQHFKNVVIWILILTSFQYLLLQNLSLYRSNMVLSFDSFMLLDKVLFQNQYFRWLYGILFVTAVLVKKNMRDIFIAGLTSLTLLFIAAYIMTWNILPWYLLFLIPTALFILSQVFFENDRMHAVSVIFSLLLLGNWLMMTNRMIHYQNDYVDGGIPSGIKNAVRVAAKEHKSLVVPLQNSTVGSQQLYNVYVNNIFDWYADIYEVPLIKIDESIYCQYISTNTNTIGLYMAFSDYCINDI